MREIIFKNLTTRNRRRRDLLILERADENGYHTEVEKRCVFLVKNHRHLQDPQAVNRWVSDHLNDPHCRLRNLSVTKRENTKTGTKHFSFKAIGSFYAVLGEEIFSVGFVQTYEVDIEESLTHGGEEWT